MPRPSNSSSFDEDIAERRVSDTLAATLLVIAAACLLGAIVLQVYECYLYRVGGTTTLVGAAKFHADTLKADLVRTCNRIKEAYARVSEAKPKKGHIEGTNFIIDEPMDLPEDIKATVETLCKDYGYGYKIFAPLVKGTGAEEKAAKVKEEATEEETEEKAVEEPKEEAVEEKAAEEPTEEATEEKAAEEPKEEAVEEKAAEEPTEEATEEKAAEEPMEEAVEEKAADEPMEEAAEEPTEEATEEPTEEATEEKAAEEPKEEATEEEEAK